MVKSIGVASLGLGISIVAVRAVRAIVQLGRRCMVPSKDESEAKECENKTTTAKQKSSGNLLTKKKR